MRPEVKNAMDIIETAVNELLEKEPDALRGASIHGLEVLIREGQEFALARLDSVELATCDRLTVDQQCDCLLPSAKQCEVEQYAKAIVSVSTGTFGVRSVCAVSSVNNGPIC